MKYFWRMKFLEKVFFFLCLENESRERAKNRDVEYYYRSFFSLFFFVACLAGRIV